LLEAFGLAVQKEKSLRLRFVGSGPLRESLARRADQLGILKNVEFAEFVQPGDMPEEYARADLFVLPTREDVFGVVVVEALACGVPVICSPFAGASDYFHDGRDGFLVDPQDQDMLSQRMLELATQPALRQSFSAQGLAIAAHFNAASVAKIFVAAILKATSNAPV
jgi:glycosyltransferase involved in cell wall biosynthesis